MEVGEGTVLVGDVVAKGGRGQQVGSIIKTDGSTTASAIKAKAESVGFKDTQTANGPLKMEWLG